MSLRKNLEVLVLLSSFFGLPTYTGCSTGMTKDEKIMPYFAQKQLVDSNAGIVVKTLMDFLETDDVMWKMHFVKEEDKIRFYRLNSLHYLSPFKIPLNIPVGEAGRIRNICYFTIPSHRGEALDEARDVSEKSEVPYFIWSLKREGRVLLLIEETNSKLASYSMGKTQIQ